MTSILDEQTIDISCPDCGTEHTKTIGWMKTNDNIACTCGATIVLDKSEFLDEIRGVEEALDAFPKEIVIKF
jgi:DNA-directed RNA polymerase subunit RPC12/RpoP